MEAFRSIMMWFMPERCFEEFFIKLNLLDVDCLKTSIVKCLGLSIIAGSTMVKVPQIVKIIRAKSSEGINIIGVLLELLGATSSAVYCYAQRYAFSSWGEALFLMLETAVIAFLVLHYGGRKNQAVAFISAYTGAVAVLVSGFVPLKVLWSLQAGNVPVVVSGKMVQALANFRQGHTGQLSAITVSLLSLGSFARILTSLEETGDGLMILTFVAATLSNFVIFIQMLYYWKTTERYLQEKKKQN